MSKPTTVTQLNLTLVWEQITAAQASITTALESHEQEDTHNTDDHISAATGNIETASAILADLRTNHTH